MRHFIGTTCLSLALLGGPVLADPSSVVVLELYTSQGCSSCPPADALLGDIARSEPDVLALSFHVDYWDYIGWTDSFADPRNTSRQKTYAHNFHERMIYTPQMVIQGQTAMVGHKAKTVASAIRNARSQPAQAQISLEQTGDMVTIAMQPVDGPVGKSDLYLIRFDPEATVQIGRGENSGRRLTYTNVVKSWHVVGKWDGQRAHEVTVPVMGDLPAAVLLQEHDQGDVLAAAALR